MGLFSKKRVVCVNCGKEYEIRIKIGKYVCAECLERIQKKRSEVFGYYQYGIDVLSTDYLEDDYDKIIERRKAIMEKCKNPLQMSLVELKEASDNYKKLSDEEAQDILFRLAQSAAESTMGAVYTKYFFLPLIYKQMIVDCEDVFAVALKSDSVNKQSGAEAIMAIVFTNDPYIPVFPMVFAGKLSYFEMKRSKKGRQAVTDFFEGMCPNLTYPIIELKELKKQIKKEGRINGNISVELMKKLISNAEDQYGIFNTTDLLSEMDIETAIMLDDIGYMLKSHMDKNLQMYKIPQRNYWTKQMNIFMKNLG